MNVMALHLLSASQAERIDGVTSFVGEDGTGSFGILPGHARFMTALGFGLARYRVHAGTWQYLALPGALLYFVDNRLAIVSRRYLRDENYERINAMMEEQLRAEEEELRAAKESLQRMEEEFFRRLWEMRRERR
jgi:F-type H+-transporting ATPase subunit epsilon